jgi:uncharacterized protein DUF5753
VALRVLPATTAPPIGTSGGFTILEFPGGIEPAMMFAQYPGGVVSEHDRRMVDQAQQRFDAVLSAALPVHDSMEFIEQLADEIYPK